MTEKKSNFLPLLLVGGGLAGAALLYGFGTKQNKEDISLDSGFGIGGSGDFYGNSETLNPIVNPSGGVPMSPNRIIMPMLYPDSTDAGIEDIARNDVNLGLTDPSSGGVNPNNYSSGTDIAQELAVYAGATAAVTAAGYGAKKVGTAIKNVGTKTAGKVATSTATKAVGSTAGKVATSTATKAAGSTAGKVISTAAKGAGVLGVLGVVDLLFDITGVKEAHFSQGGLTGNLQGINTSYTINTGGIKTDKATSEEVGNVALNEIQKQYLSNMETFGGTTREATASEAAEINKRLGSSGSVGVYEYKGKTGSQTTYITSTGKTITNPTGTSTKNTSNGSSSGSSSGSSGGFSSSIGSIFSGLFGGK